MIFIKIIKSLLKVERSDLGIFSSLIKIAFPLMLSSLLQTLYNITDAFFLGKLGKEELSAPTIAFNIIFFLVIFGMGMSMAGTTLIAQSKGKGDDRKVDFYLGQTAVILLIFSVVLSVIGILATDPLLYLLQTPPEVFEHTHNYMIIIMAGLPFMFGFFVLQGSLQGIGNTVTPLWVQAITIVINVVLDPLMIFGLLFFPPLGVVGAALATLIARSIASIIALYILFKGNKGIKLRFSDMIPRKESVLLFLRIGLPASIGQALSALGFTVLQGLVNYFGTAVIAAFGVGNRIISLYNQPAMGISRATTTLVGQSVGAKDINRARRVVRVSVLAILAFLIPATSLTFFWGNYFVKFFVNDPETIWWGEILFKIVSPSVIFFGLFTVVNGAFQGAGDTKPIMFMSIARLWVIRVPLAFLLALMFNLGPLGIWIAMFVSNISVSLFGIAWFRRGRWVYAVDVDKI